MAAPRSTARRFLSLSLQQTRCYSAPTDGAIPPNKAQYVPSSGTYPKGFIVGSAHAQVKASNTKFDDLALIASEKPCAAAVVSTQNVFRAAPVKATLWTMKGSGGRGIRGVVINSGCANAVTGSGGMDDAVHMARLTDNALRERNPSDNDPSPSAGDETNAVTGLRTLVMSTGVIGQRLPIDRITSKIPALVDSVGNSHDHWLRCARAICTTDTFPKLMSRQFSLPGYPGVTFSMAGMTKGAGMIHPNMATLLGAICTDVPIDADALRSILKKAVNKSFNRITVDGDTSTNDTVAVFANGMAAPDAPQIHIKKNATKSARQTEDFEAFSNELSSFMQDLAKLIVRDGEGATKFVAIRVQKASTPEIAHAVANSIATSALVKTALYGKDANWGRILCAIGYAPGDNFIRPNGVSVSFVPADGSEELKLLVNGEPQQIDETRASAILEHEDLEILVNLSNKPEYKGETTVYTCDFSHEYVTINGDYRT